VKIDEKTLGMARGHRRVIIVLYVAGRERYHGYLILKINFSACNSSTFNNITQ
jgi:hypothetical protein